MKTTKFVKANHQFFDNAHLSLDFPLRGPMMRSSLTTLSPITVQLARVDFLWQAAGILLIVIMEHLMRSGLVQQQSSTFTTSSTVKLFFLNYVLALKCERRSMNYVYCGRCQNWSSIILRKEVKHVTLAVNYRRF